jgi:general secretion pathway protein H
VIRPDGRDAQAGISLIEVLVVLAIVGVMTGATVIGLGALDRGGRAEAEARRLADRLELATDEALVTDTPLALVWDARGYRFLGWDGQAGAWAPAALPALGEPHALPAALRIEGDEEAPVLIAPDLARSAVQLRVSGGDRGWRVAFDGFATSAEPVSP